MPDGPLTLELIAADGSTKEASLSVVEVNGLLKQANEKAKALGMGWDREPVRLKPAPKVTDPVLFSSTVTTIFLRFGILVSCELMSTFSK